MVSSHKYKLRAAEDTRKRTTKEAKQAYIFAIRRNKKNQMETDMRLNANADPYHELDKIQAVNYMSLSNIRYNNNKA